MLAVEHGAPVLDLQSAAALMVASCTKITLTAHTLLSPRQERRTASPYLTWC